MPQAPPVGDGSQADRLPRLLALLRMQPLPAEALFPRLNRMLKEHGQPGISLRTLQHDLEWLLKHLGPTIIERVPRSRLDPQPAAEFRHHRWFYRLHGAEELIPISGQVLFLTELEALALVTARAQLAVPPLPASSAATQAGPLADALERLIGRLGLSAKDRRIPDILAVSQSTPQPYDPAVALTILRAIRCGEALAMTYQPLDKPAHPVVVQPVRMVLVDGEPFLWAWDPGAARLKNYKLARMTGISRSPALQGTPTGLDAEVRGSLAASFHGVSGHRQRGRVVLRATPAAIPHLRHRRLGSAQTWEDLPDGGARIAFNTSGLEAVRHWLLQYGSKVVVESPDSLVAWMREELTRMTRAYA